MARETSVEAYHDVMECGFVGRRQRDVYSILYEHGPLVGSAVASLWKERNKGESHSETIRNRLTELRDMGAVYEVGTTKDDFTGRRVILWDVTRDKPVKRSKRLTGRKELLALRIAVAGAEKIIRTAVEESTFSKSEGREWLLVNGRNNADN